jgi:hypothetical protein
VGVDRTEIEQRVRTNGHVHGVQARAAGDARGSRVPARVLVPVALALAAVVLWRWLERTT